MGLNRNLGNIPEVITELNGNIGIGTTNPSEKLSVKAADAAIKLEGATNSYLFQIVDSNNRLRIFDNTNNTERITLTSGGNVGIGNISPTSAGGYATLSIGGSGSTKGQITWNSGATNIGYAYNDATNMTFGANNDLIFATTGSGTERMRITSGGNVLLSSGSDNGYKLQVNGSITAAALSLSGNFLQDVTTNSGWSSYQTIISPGTLLPGVTYMISIRWNFSAGSNQPYYCYCSFLWVGVPTNGAGGTDNEFTPACSTHTGGGGNISFRSIAALAATSGVQARLNGFATFGGVMTVKAIRLE